MKKDPYNQKKNWLNWKARNQTRISDISKYNSDLILQYLRDMELGINIAMTNIKGSRSYTRLNTLKTRMVFLTKEFEKRYKLNKITDLSELQVCDFFASMRNGNIKKQDGGIYKSVRDYAKVFKAFWHWWQKISNKQGKDIPDITVYIDTTGSKPEWVYLNEEQIKQLRENATYEYKVLITFLFDSGIRSPTELINVKVSDLYKDYKELNIRDEISKTFGRRIKLMLCPDLLRDYIKNNKLKPENYLFPINPKVVNRYFKRLAKKLFGDKPSLAGQKYSELTLYDFRHISCCYWLPRYKSESALKFRFGWKKSDKIHYYSEMLGMRDTISEEDLLIDVTKTELEKRLTKSEQKAEMQQEKMKLMEMQMQKVLQVVDKSINAGKEILVVQEN